jgi:hypothetical protein
MDYRITNDDKQRKPSYSMRLKLEKPPGAAGTSTPGPGNYNLGTTSMTYQAASATRKGVKMLSRPEHRVDAVSGAQLVGTAQAIPGPGAYDMGKEAMARTSATPAWTMATKTPHNMNGEIVSPGPAAYLPNDNYLPKKQAQSMGMRYIKNTENSGPGPMSYMPQYGKLSRSQSQPSVTMALKHTDAASRENTPGPGAYNGYRKVRSVSCVHHLSVARVNACCLSTHSHASHFPRHTHCSCLYGLHTEPASCLHDGRAVGRRVQTCRHPLSL